MKQAFQAIMIFDSNEFFKKVELKSINIEDDQKLPNTEELDIVAFDSDTLANYEYQYFNTKPEAVKYLKGKLIDIIKDNKILRINLDDALSKAEDSLQELNKL